MDFSGLEKLSLVDFDDNITATVFSAGCNMRCPFCHNMDLVINPGKAPKIPWETIYGYLEKRKGVLDAVCVSGGEPTLMDDLLDKLSQIKALGYKIKLDTNGSNPKILKEVVSKGLVDYVAMDIKNSLARYPETIGVKSFDLEPIKESIEYLKSGVIPYEFRTTVMDEFHDEASMKELGELIKGCPRYFIQRYIDSEHCIVGGFTPVAKEKAEEFLKILAPYVGEAKLRSYD